MSYRTRLALRPFSGSSLVDLNKEFFDQLFQDFTPATTVNSFQPHLNLREDKDAYLVEAELPGLKKDDIEINIIDNILHLKGEKKFAQEEKKENYHRVERSYGKFHRTISLQHEVDLEKVSANFENGVLLIELGKALETKTNHKKIEIR